jgi:polyhydroxybutyrate depolymerase
VYINGLSNGGGMSHRFACEMAFRVAAFGGVAGAYANFGACEPSRPVPVIAFHGTDDRIVPYAGQGNVLPPIEDWAREWAGRNTCADMVADIPLADDVTVTTWSACQGGAEVVLYTVIDGGHTWPGSSAVNDSPLGRITDSIDASALMWEFFSRYALPMS